MVEAKFDRALDNNMMCSAIPFDLARMPRFGAIGLLNTALGYALILAGLALELGGIASNAVGYAAGPTLGFFLNRQWTFDDTAT